MAQLAIYPGAEPFSADGGRIGVVVSHGFTGSPFSMRPWAQHLAAAGYSVRLPLLPGHGTSWQDLNTKKWRDWYATIDAAFEELSGSCEQVFAAGLSMGGTLTTRLAELKGDRLSGLIVVNPSYGMTGMKQRLVPLVKYVMKSQSGIGSDIKRTDVVSEGGYDRTPIVAFAELRKLWKVVTADFAKITAPIVMYRSVDDHVVEPLSAQLLKVGAVNTTIREQLLLDSYHVATLDNDAETIFTGSVDFIKSIVSESPEVPRP